MKITLITKSELLCSTGESSAWIDADLKYDKFGFPFIQGKTYKGLLRESMLEVTEMLGTPDAIKIVERLFGRKGDSEGGILHFNNLYPASYDMVARIQLSKHRDILNKGFVRSFYTTTIAQTAINDEGVAKDKSLRKYRLLKRGIILESKIDDTYLLDDTQQKLLEKAIINLRYMGVRRNRGFGEIAARICETDNLKTDNKVVPVFTKSASDIVHQLNFQIKLIDPVVIARIFGEQNTVSTYKTIPAQLIRGIIARQIIINFKLSGADASNNDTFRELILDNKISYNPAFINDALPVPKAYGFNKTLSGNPPLVIRFDTDKPLKQLNGFGLIIKDNLKQENPEVVFSFHHSRYKTRIAGKSTEENGGIYYYESLDADQIFDAKIIGLKAYLDYIQLLLELDNGVHNIGKSRSAQYGRIQFGEFRITEVKKETVSNEVSILFLSPVITRNDFGLAVPDLKNLKSELKENYGIDVTHCDIASSPEWVENYMGVWKSKTAREAAFDTGTTLRIKFVGILDKTRMEQFGLGERKAEGYGKVKVIELRDILNRIDVVGTTTPENRENFTSFDHVLLDSLLDKQKANEEMLEIKSIAIDYAHNKRKSITNSLVGRLYDAVWDSSDLNAWNSFKNGIVGKKAYRSLDDANMLNDIESLSIPSQRDLRDFVKQKQFWLYVLKTMRVKTVKE